MADDRQELLHAEIMIDEEAARRPFTDEDAHVALGLFIVEHMDDGQHGRPHRLEQFAECMAVHVSEASRLRRFRKFIMMMPP